MKTGSESCHVLIKFWSEYYSYNITYYSGELSGVTTKVVYIVHAESTVEGS